MWFRIPEIGMALTMVEVPSTRPRRPESERRIVSMCLLAVQEVEIEVEKVELDE